MFQSYQEIIKRMSGHGQSDDPRRPAESVDEQQELDKQDSVSTEYLVHNWLEAVFAWFQVIVLWHEPQISVCAISGLLSSFLLLTYFAPRFYATIMIAIFIYNLNKFWFRHVWPEIRVPPARDREDEMRLDVDRWTYLHPQLMTLKEFKNHIRHLMRLLGGYWRRLLNLRNQRPTYFCSQLCFVFSCTAYLGKTISGLTLVFCTLVIIISAPGIYAHLLPERYKHWLKQRYLCLICLNETLPENEPPIHRIEQEVEETASHKSTAGPRSWDTIQASIASNMKSIESNFRKFANLRTNSHQTKISTSKNSSNLHAEEQEQTCANPLSSLRQDGARVLYNLIDVTLMGSGGKDCKQEGSNEGEEEVKTDEAVERPSSDVSSANETISLVENEDEQQDDGFVML